MKICIHRNNIMWILGLLIVGALISSWPIVSIADDTKSQEIQFKIVSILDRLPQRCGLHQEGETDDLKNHSMIHLRKFYQEDSSMDIAPAIISLISRDNLFVSQRDKFLLIRSLGELDISVSEPVIRDIYQNAYKIGEQMFQGSTFPPEIPVSVKDDYESRENEIRRYAINSNVADVKLAVINAVAGSRAKSMADILEAEANEEGRVGVAAKKALEKLL